MFVHVHASLPPLPTSSSLPTSQLSRAFPVNKQTAQFFNYLIAENAIETCSK